MFAETVVEQPHNEDTLIVIDVVGDGEDNQDPSDHAQAKREPARRYQEVR